MHCPLVRPALPHIRFLFVGSRLCSTLPSDGPSRFRPCASLVLHLHQVTQGTFTPKLSDMSDTHAGLRPPPPAAYGVDSACHPAVDCHQEADGKVRPIRLQMSCRKISLRQLCADPDRRSQLGIRSRFVGLGSEDGIPDGTTLSLFREKLVG